ncbi:hypothetical protein ACQ4PT_043753 [Festuca glaucescens]
MLLGTIHNRDYTLDLAELGLRSMDLSELDEEFTEQEVWEVIKEVPQDRAPGPDGFIGAFYQHAWQWIRQDAMAALCKFRRGDGICFGKLNSALITLIPKKEEALEVGAYHPISLIHNFAKLCSKILANRLRPKMDNIISTNQSAFIRGRCLHDNFLLVRKMARNINARK